MRENFELEAVDTIEYLVFLLVVITKHAALCPPFLLVLW